MSKRPWLGSSAPPPAPPRRSARLTRAERAILIVIALALVVLATELIVLYAELR